MKNMKMIQNFMKSFGTSTNVSVTLKGEHISCCGLNSMYTSHMSVQFTCGHNLSETMVMWVKNRFIVITPLGLGIVADGFKSFEFPSCHINKNIPVFLREFLPNWFTGLVSVSYVDLFIGFSESGEPMFKSELPLFQGKNNEFCQTGRMPRKVKRPLRKTSEEEIEVSGEITKL